MSNSKQKTPTYTAKRLLNQAQAIKLRAHGLAFRDIAKTLGCSLAVAHALVSEAFAAERESISQAKADLVELEVLRCDSYLQVISKKVQAGDIRAVECALKVADRRAKLLGLDAPTKVAETDSSGNDLSDEARAIARRKLIGE